MEGTKRKADAVAFARGFIEHHFDSPADSWYYVQPYPGGYAFEVHEGGLGKAFLPNIIETLEVNPTAVLSVPMARRNLQVKKSLNGTYTAILLPEGLSTDEDHAVEAVSSRSMLRVTTTGLGIFTFGGIIFSAGFLAFFSALLMVFLDPAGIFFGGSRGTELQQLPILQWKSLSSASNDQSYVRNLSFSNGKWAFEVGKRSLVDETGKPIDAKNLTPEAPQKAGPQRPTQQTPANPAPAAPDALPSGEQQTTAPGMEPEIPAAPANTGMQLPVSKTP
ncbi:MAG TPA: hypothetical protein DCW68_05320 [Rhodospirillaceae bacterium]|nr:MAG: hypothetical protein A2018_02330 [Alphaproteobacteria bacterium GWF2_58_20]HAU29515.1 hypothetical protein [Rhodospirillaceae bacterium]